MEKRQIYLDHGASTPLDEAVMAAMQPYWAEVYGNPGSAHGYGRSANHALETARRTVADLLHAQPDEVAFTGCGSESDNLALRGVMWAARRDGGRNDRGGNHLITSAIEHSAVLGTAVQLRDLFGFDLTILPVDEYGRVRPADVAAAIRPDTVLISIMAANNEIGTVQPIAEIGAIARERGVFFHTDAIQLAASVQWDMSAMPIDLLSIAPHKFYGPKGVGIFYARQDVPLVSALTGGGQENGRRAGTVNVPFAVGAAEALRLAMVNLPQHIAHYQALRDRLIDGILAQFPNDAVLTGHPTERLPHNASFAFRNLNANDLLMHLDMAGIAASSGSACKTGNPKPSAVLQAIGLGDEWNRSGLRLTVGKQNTLADIDYALETLASIVPKLYKLQAVSR
ncbi:MAG: cysteine desulfurase [Ardenticatenaceae bacterium]|nr:cysteine desulfurase [Ardenticatenaceae bacterium]MCB8990259.1 cysteine desulfurase [Ardenticatenaceae bacterium]MCB9002949.1 cysteine desulfurase [Ardenticatenaceae bacterium]